mgnify:FL=1
MITWNCGNCNTIQCEKTYSIGLLEVCRRSLVRNRQTAALSSVVCRCLDTLTPCPSVLLLRRPARFPPVISSSLFLFSCAFSCFAVPVNSVTSSSAPPPPRLPPRSVRLHFTLRCPHGIRTLLQPFVGASQSSAPSPNSLTHSLTRSLPSTLNTLTDSVRVGASE